MFDYSMISPEALGGMRFAAAMAEYYGEADTDVETLDEDIS